MKIGIDIMGGDFAPKAILEGTILAQKQCSEADKIVLFGNEKEISSFFSYNDINKSAFEFVNSSNDILMTDNPIRSLSQKPDSSIAKGFSFLKQGKIDAFCSSGNSGAMLVGSIYSVGAIPGIIRPVTAAIIPKWNGGVGILVDVGTNPDCKPDTLYQFAILASIFAESVYKIKNPKVALLNIGEEEGKGNILCQATFKVMKGTLDFNFVGNVEGKDFFNDKADVIVCDGFTGNVVLKHTESFYSLMKKSGFKNDFIDNLNYENFGGTPILGVNSTVVIGHGNSSVLAIKNMILLTKRVYKQKLSEKISQAIKEYTKQI